MGARKERELETRAQGRAVTYCLIPRDLAPKLHDALRSHFLDHADVEVIVERRDRTLERRSQQERRTKAKDEPLGARERRTVLSASGRRTGERRARLAPVAQPPALPRRAQRFADRIAFVQRLEPAGLVREDRDTARLVAKFQAGDREVFGVLYSRYFDRVFGYLRVLLKNRDEAEDATQQVFAQLFEALPKYEQLDRPFRAWMFTVARNVGISTLRRQSRLEPMDPHELGERLEQDDDGEELTALSWITDPDLLIFVERLPQPQRQVLALRYMFDLTARQVSEVLGRSENEVRMLQHRAQKFLRDRLTAIGRAPKASERSKSLTRPRQAIVVRERRFMLQP